MEGAVIPNQQCLLHQRQSSSLSDGELKSEMCSPEMQVYLPFITEGLVSVVESNNKAKVKILRDAFDSFILASALPFSDESSMSY